MNFDNFINSNHQLIILISGIKINDNLNQPSDIAQLLAHSLNLDYLDSSKFSDSGFDLIWNDFNSYVNSHNKGIVVSGQFFPIDKINFNPDFHFNIFTPKNLIISFLNDDSAKKSFNSSYEFLLNNKSKFKYSKSFVINPSDFSNTFSDILSFITNSINSNYSNFVSDNVSRSFINNVNVEKKNEKDVKNENVEIEKKDDVKSIPTVNDTKEVKEDKKDEKEKKNEKNEKNETNDKKEKIKSISTDKDDNVDKFDKKISDKINFINDDNMTIYVKGQQPYTIYDVYNDYNNKSYYFDDNGDIKDVDKDYVHQQELKLISKYSAGQAYVDKFYPDYNDYKAVKSLKQQKKEYEQNKLVTKPSDVKSDDNHIHVKTSYVPYSPEKNIIPSFVNFNL